MTSRAVIRTFKVNPAIFVLMSILSCTPVQAQNPANLDRVEEMRKWVSEVEKQDYFFWRRYLERLDRDGSQFPQPASWYRPAEIVEGAESAPLVRLAAGNRTISGSALESVRKYAMDRSTGALVVARHGVVEFEAYGPGITSTSLLTSRSLAKTVLTALYGVAIENNAIGSLEDPVGKYLEEWADDPRGQITIRQMLSFTSGLETVSMGKFDPDSKAVRLAEGSSVNKTALSYVIAEKPDTVMTVNNADSQIAGLVLERATGRRYAELVSDWLWRPLGAGTATINLDQIDGDARSFCCMQVRPVDWIRFGQMLLHSGASGDNQVIPAAFVERMKERGPVNPLVGLSILEGWDRSDDPALKSRLIIPQSEPFNSSGIFYLLGGRSITLWVVPEFDMVVFRWGDDAKDWDNSYIVNHLIDDIAR